MSTPSRIDPVTFELIKNGLSFLCDEMALTMARAAYSPILREVLDYSTALLTPEGEVMAQGRTHAMHLGSIMYALEGIKEAFGDDMHPGDLFISNDPYRGGSHLPDVFLLKPLFVGGKLAAFVGGEAHMSDMGGRVPGSNASDSTEIYQEGLRIPPSKLMIGGERNRVLWDILEANVRHADKVLGDLHAILAAIAVGERGLARYFDQYGYTTFRSYVGEIMDYTERMTRAEIASWPDGEYSFEDAIDDDGMGSGLVPIKVTIRVKGDGVEFDFTGTGGMVRSAINNPITFTAAACFFIVRSAVPMPLPHNSGFTRAVKVHAPKGCILNAQPPAAVTARALTAYRALDAIVGAMAQIVPQRMLAGDEGGNALLTFAGEQRGDERAWLLTESFRGAWGARHDRDGVDAITGIAAPSANVPCEILELEYPLRVSEYGFVQDAAGHGRYRGGLGMVREYEILRDETLVQVRSDRFKTRTYGLYGGHPGSYGANTLNPGRTGERALPSKFLVWMNKGDRFRCQLASAGGWGDPLDRAPAQVLADVEDGKIGRKVATEIYGVEFDPATGAVDVKGTGRRRAALRAQAGETTGTSKIAAL
jgi:N-methylhydantoinase B